MKATVKVENLKIYAYHGCMKEEKIIGSDYVVNVTAECFLENVQVSYGGDRYKTFEPHADDGAPPVETSITLAFKEIEIMTRERIFEGY